MNRSSIFWGIVLILFGALFILNNLGYFNFNLWQIIGPVLLILFGAWVILGPLLDKDDSLTNVSVPLEQVNSADIKFDFAAGKLSIFGNSNSSSILEGRIRGGHEIVKKVNNSKGIYHLNIKPSFFPFLWIPYRYEWNLHLNNSIPLSLTFNTGATDTTVDLTGLKIRGFLLNTGASSTNIILSSEPGTGQYVVKAGLAAVKIEIPGEVGARIRATTGLGIVNVDHSRFTRIHGEYRSSNFETAPSKADLVIEIGLGSVDIV